MLARTLQPHLLCRQLHFTQLPCRHAIVAAATAAAAADGGSAAAPRRRRKLFKPEDYSISSQPQQEQQQQQTQEDPAGSRRRSRRLTTQQPHQQQQEQAPQQQQQEQQQQQQQQQRWWQHPAAPAEIRLHVYWDLDNLHPAHWEQAADLVDALKGVLLPYGRLQEMQAYANTKTLVQTVGVDGIEEFVQKGNDELRCEICGRRCKSFDDLQKHFRQLHEREHQKKLRGPKKAAAKYHTSDKAQRVRDAGRLFGTPKKNRSGRKGQMVKLLLQRAGVKVIEVAMGQKQAADDAINRHVDKLTEKLKAADPEPWSAAAVAAAAAANAGLAPWGCDSALQQTVLVLVSDDRGFAATAARWLQRGGAGVVMVTSRGGAGWQKPLGEQLGSRGSSGRLADVVCVSWDDMVTELAFKSWGEDGNGVMLCSEGAMEVMSFDDFYDRLFDI